MEAPRSSLSSAALLPHPTHPSPPQRFLNLSLQKSWFSLPLKEDLEALQSCYLCLRRQGFRSSRHPKISVVRRLWQSLVMSSDAVGVRERMSRRGSIVLFLMMGVGGMRKAAAAEGLDPPVDLELERFTDEKEGFTLLKPAHWSKESKAGATVLFEDPITKSNNLGVVVSPVRISSLQEFGSSQDVARKLIEAEQKKPSTNAASLVSIKERFLNDRIPLYQYEYTLDSSRGMKRVFAAVTIASKKLYIVNVAYKDNLETSLSPYVSEKLRAIVASFDLLH